MRERFLKVTPDAEQRQEERYRLWLSGQGIPFINDEAKAMYQERVMMIKDAVQLKKKPARVPLSPSCGFFPMEYAGITMYDAMYDYAALQKAFEKYNRDFATDTVAGPGMIVPGKPLEILGLKLYKWPGYGVSKEREYQFVEGEYMKQDEYMDLIDDPTAFFLNKYLPRIFGTLEPFQGFPSLPPMNEIPNIPPTFAALGSDVMKAVYDNLYDAGQEILRWRAKVGEITVNIMKEGFPGLSGGFTKAPFDVIGDSLRGTRGVMLDIYRYPDELKEACERLTPIMIKSGVAGCRASGHLMPYIPLHKGADGFMSDEQFATFYWPTLRKVIIGLINEGMVPILFAEGAYNQRLEVISDLPKGMCIWYFDRTDMVRAKATVGRVACIMGNFPLALLCAGNPDEVRAECKSLMQAMKPGGGYIFSTGAGIQGSKPENVKAMIETAKEFS